MSEAEDDFDWGSADGAEAVMSRVCADEAMRREILQCLLDSIAFVDQTAPDAWAVTLQGNGFRLNVGQVEALTCDAGWPFPPYEGGAIAMRVLTHGALPDDVLAWSGDGNPSLQLGIAPASYKSIPAPKHIVKLAAKQPGSIRPCYEKLMRAHESYLSSALQTPTGKIRSGTPFKRTHSEDLVAYAKAVCGTPFVSHIAEVAAEQDGSVAEYFEGRPIAIQTTRYERDQAARRACLNHHGYSCAACGFNFGAVYGAVAEHYVQVHHVRPLAAQGSTGATDPVKDLIPLCANCHAVAHFRNPPYTVEEIRKFVHKE